MFLKNIFFLINIKISICIYKLFSKLSQIKKKYFSKKDFCIESQEIGDIILVSNKAFSSKLQRGMQSLGKFKYSKFSHAILALHKGIYIESMKDKNVEHNVTMFCIDELRKRLKEDYQENWKIIRLKNVDNNVQNSILKAADYFYGQRYNNNPLQQKIHGKYNTQASFCSELIQRVYKQSGIVIGKNNQDIWPIDLDDLTKSSNDTWEEVTETYNKKCTSLCDEKFYLPFCKQHVELTNALFISKKQTANSIKFTSLACKYIEVHFINFKKLIVDEGYHNLLKIISNHSEITFYDQFISPIQLRSINKTLPVNIEKNSYIFEEIALYEPKIFGENYSNLFNNQYSICKDTIFAIIYYFYLNISLKGESLPKIYPQWIEQLKDSINLVASYKDDDIKKSEEKFFSVIGECDVDFNEKMIFIIESMKKINFIKNNHVISTKKMNPDFYIQFYSEFSNIRINNIKEN